MIQHLRLVLTGFLLATILIAGCAIPKRTEHQNQPETPVWRGRLALQIEPDSSQAQASSFSAGFELTGNAQVGELTLFTPLGSTAASLIWSEKSALMRTSSDTRHFESLDALIKHAIGTELPVATLFAWLAGENLAAAGWHADLSQHARGRITAQRSSPSPTAELRLVLED